MIGVADIYNYHLFPILIRLYPYIASSRSAFYYTICICQRKLKIQKKE